MFERDRILVEACLRKNPRVRRDLKATTAVAKEEARLEPEGLAESEIKAAAKQTTHRVDRECREIKGGHRAPEPGSGGLEENDEEMGVSFLRCKTNKTR